MSTPEVVRGFFDLLASEGPDSALARFADENVVYVEDPQWPGSATYRGRKSVAACWANYEETLGDEVGVSVGEITQAATCAVAIVRISGRARGSGVPFEHTWAYLCRIEQGRLSCFRAYLNPPKALEAAGTDP